MCLFMISACERRNSPSIHLLKDAVNEEEEEEEEEEEGRRAVHARGGLSSLQRGRDEGGKEAPRH